MSQARLPHDELRSRVFEITWLNSNSSDSVANQRLLAPDTRRFLQTWLQESVGEFITGFFDHICAEQIIFYAGISKYFDVVKTKAHQGCENICQAKLKGAPSLPESGANNNFTGASFSSGSRDGNESGKANPFSRHTHRMTNMVDGVLSVKVCTL